jgi:ParB/RepB/Spo0J family partition protein
MAVVELPVSAVKPNPRNPRRDFDAAGLDELAQSIREVGVLQPVLVVPDDGGYRLVAGERRYRAACLAGQETIPAIVRDLTPEQEVQVMLIENLQRQELNPVEEAAALHALVSEFGWKQEALAQKLGVSQPWVANRIRLLRLPAEVLDLISRGILTAHHGLALLKVAAAEDIWRECVERFRRWETPAARAGSVVDDVIKEKGRPLFTKSSWSKPLFDLRECTDAKCRYRVHAAILTWDGAEAEEDEGQEPARRERPFCLKPSCWDEKQQKALEEENRRRQQEWEERRRALGEGAGSCTAIVENPREELGYDNYRWFGGTQVDPVECALSGCGKLQLGRYFDGILKELCLDPSCFEKKLKRLQKKSAEEEKARRKELEVRIRAFVDAVDGPPGGRMLVFLAAQMLMYGPTSSQWTHEKIRREVYKRYGWPYEWKTDYAGWRENIDDLVARFATLEETELWRVLVFASLRPVEPNDRIFAKVFGDGDEAGEGHPGGD